MTAADAPSHGSIPVKDAAVMFASGLPDGMTLLFPAGANFAELMGRPRQTGTFAVRLTATSAGGSAEIAFGLTVNPPIGPALDAESLTWRSGAGSSRAWIAGEHAGYWTPASDGVDAVRLLWRPDAATDGPAWIETNVTGPDVLHFQWLGGWNAAPGSVSVLLDGQPITGLTISSVWRRTAVAIPAGSHTIRWQAGSAAREAALDEVFLESDARSFLLEDSQRSFAALRPVNATLKLSRPGVVSVAGDLPPGLSISSEGVITGRPARSGTWPVMITTVTPAGTATRKLDITIAPPCLPDWLALHGLTGVPLTSDADGDRISLLAEFALGGDPAKPDYHLLPKISVTAHDVSWEFPRGDYEPNNIFVLMEYSPYLRWGWTRYACYPTTDEAGLPVHRGSLQFGWLPPSGFFRVRIDVHNPGRD
jgi:hypothetical protein